jgi:DNA-directed RNA polymerase specialized sigma24 family protein
MPDSDEDLVRRVCANDNAAAEELFIVRCGKTFAALSRQFRYDELLNDLYLHLREDDWRRLQTWENFGPLEGWMRKAAFRLCLHHAKSEGRLVALPSDSFETLLASIFESPDDYVLRAELLRAIEHLKDQRQRYLMRGALADRAIEEMAEELMIRRSYADVLKNRAIAELRVLFGIHKNKDGKGEADHG